MQVGCRDRDHLEPSRVTPMTALYWRQCCYSDIRALWEGSAPSAVPLIQSVLRTPSAVCRKNKSHLVQPLLSSVKPARPYIPSDIVRSVSIDVLLALLFRFIHRIKLLVYYTYSPVVNNFVILKSSILSSPAHLHSSSVMKIQHLILRLDNSAVNVADIPPFQ